MKANEKLDVREIRRKLGLNQSQFWSKIGVTQSGGSRYESGRNIPRPVQALLRLVHVEQIDMEPEQAFGLVLRQLRQQAGLSQEKLAFDAELDRNYVSLLELGRNSASVKTIFKLAPALGVTVAELMGLVEASLTTRQPGKPVT